MIDLITQLTYPILIIMHIIGVAMGVGGAITTDVTFLRSIWDRTMTTGQLQLIEAISKVVVTGLGLLILSGASLVILHPHYLSLSDGIDLFWVKMTIVTILSINGFVFHKKILPILRRHADKTLNSDEVRNKLWLLAITGGLSGISWFSVLILGVMMQAIDFPYLLIINVYLLAVLGAILTGYVGIYWILFSNLREPKTGQATKYELPKPRKLPWLNRVIMGVVVLVVLLIGLLFSLGIFGESDDNDQSAQATTHGDTHETGGDN